jgi:plastocyanin
MKKFNGSKSRFITGMVFLISILMISNSCNKSSYNNMTGMTSNPGTTGNTGGPGPNEVFIQGMAFSPANLTVTAGTTITWTNKDAVAHTVTSNIKLFNSGTIGSNGTFSYTFTSTGTFSYYCAIHPSMVASVTVN